MYVHVNPHNHRLPLVSSWQISQRHGMGIDNREIVHWTKHEKYAVWGYYSFGTTLYIFVVMMCSICGAHWEPWLIGIYLWQPTILVGTAQISQLCVDMWSNLAWTLLWALNWASEVTPICTVVSPLQPWLSVVNLIKLSFQCVVS